ncbi:MAG: Do family serine endopeptidase [Candidatus Brocadiia bacterium]
MNKKWSIAVVMAFVLAAALIFSGILATPTPPSVRGQAPAAVEEQRGEEYEELAEFAGKLERLFNRAARDVTPAVVAIQTERVERRTARAMPFRDPFFDDFWRRRFPGLEDFFGGPEREYEQRKRGLGSGMILDQDGHILTNNHVVEGADELSVTLADRREFEAEMVGTDDKTDLAVIRMKGDFGELSTVTLGDSGELNVGQWVMAVGSPFGLSHTVSAGIVSAKGRSGFRVTEYEDWIQTDAAINPGNSGGPLINLRGEVVGINTFIVSSAGGNLGIGFAIPVSMATAVLDDLVAGREVERGYLGVTISDLSAEMAEMFDFEGTEGVLVQEVLEDGPAAEAGLEAGDIIVEYDGEPVTRMGELRQAVAATDPGETATVVFWRDGQEMTRRVKVGELGTAALPADWFGAQVRPLTEEDARDMGRPRMEGMLVLSVEPGTPAARALTEGDVILSINRQRVADRESYRRALERAREGERMLIRVLDAESGAAVYQMLRLR